MTIFVSLGTSVYKKPNDFSTFAFGTPIALTMVKGASHEKDAEKIERQVGRVPFDERCKGAGTYTEQNLVIKRGNMNIDFEGTWIINFDKLIRTIESIKNFQASNESKVCTIKWVRQELGCGLIEAKKLVDATWVG